MSNGNEPAFSAKELRTHGYTEYMHFYTGLTKREYFAGLAMQNLQNVLLRRSSDNRPALDKVSSLEMTQAIAAYAVGQADALLAELEKK